jgi:hypothetical protein
MKQFLTASMCGWRASSATVMPSRRMFRNLTKHRVSAPASHGAESSRKRGTHWSTDLSVPVIARSFLSSTVTRWSVSVLKTEKMSCQSRLSP